MLTTAAVIVARARTGRTEDALSLSQPVFSEEGVLADIGDGARGALLLAASEAYVTAGWPRRATVLALRAAHYAAGTDPAAEYRARALLAVSRALNGEYEQAGAEIDRCERLRAASGWTPSTADYPLLLGEILTASARLDGARLREIVLRLRHTAPYDLQWIATARTTEAMALLADNDVNRALPLVLSVIAGADEVGILDMIRGFAVGIHADLLLARGEARRTLTALKDRVSPPGHALCFDMQRAAALLLLGDDRRVLTVTDGCIRMGAEHCLRTIPPVLFRRALAFARLGHDRLADETFEEAFHLVLDSGSATPLLTLPAGELHHLLDRLEARRPELADRVAVLKSRIAVVPASDADRPVLPAFTKREGVLAVRLRTGASFAEIADQLHVSAHTVKTQAHSLYRKLGVNSRQETVAALERAGFYD